MGYGFVDRSADLSNVDELENYLIPQKDSVDVWRILRNKMVG
jgi:DNA polymerase-3 subunit epsilon